MKDKETHISVRLPELLVGRLYFLVSMGRFKSMSHAVRVAIMRFLDEEETYNGMTATYIEEGLKMKLTKQDIITFALGAVGAAAAVIGQSFPASFETLEDLQTWGTALVAGLAAALFRYVATYLVER